MKDQKDCVECVSIQPGKPRCGYCLSDLIGELHAEAIQLRSQLAEARKVLRDISHCNGLDPEHLWANDYNDPGIIFAKTIIEDLRDSAGAFLAKYPKGD